MASRSSRPKLERITYEDLMSSSGMSGFDALVRTTLQTFRPRWTEIRNSEQQFPLLLLLLLR
jgi:hypothetical protein